MDRDQNSNANASATQADVRGAAAVRLQTARTRSHLLVFVLLLVATVTMLLLHICDYRILGLTDADQRALFRSLFQVDTMPMSEILRLRNKCIGVYNLTVVTAFFKIASFPKGSFTSMRGPDSYVKWLRGYSSLLNPVVFFTDDASIKQMFEEWRSPSRDVRLCTAVYLVNREEFWPWRSLANFSEALQIMPYHPSPPCTTNPEYNAATNSKYRNSIEDELNSTFLLLPLPSLQPGRVGYLEIRPKPTATLEAFILHHIDWMAGGMFYGEADAMLRLTHEFSRYAKLFMRYQLVGADQQILGAMYGGTNIATAGFGYPTVQLQLYKPNPSASPDPWFHLAYPSNDQTR